MHRRQFLVMLGVAPVAFAAAKYLPAQPKPQNDYVCKALRATFKTVEFTTSHRFEPGDVVTFTGTKWAGTYKMNLDGVSLNPQQNSCTTPRPVVSLI